MRRLIIILSLLVAQKIYGQINGLYYDVAHIGESLILNNDTSFFYKIEFDISKIYGSGKYSIEGDTLIMKFFYLRNYIWEDSLKVIKNAAEIDPVKFLIKGDLLYALDKKKGKIIKRVKNGFIYKKVFFIFKKTRFKYYLLKQPVAGSFYLKRLSEKS
jgi:hypothetical protein